jgi:hypothetical protein
MDTTPTPVRAKMFVNSVTPTVADEPDAVSRTVQMGAVCRGVENAIWASATPAASLTMTIRNDAATEQFVQGEEYDLLFTHSPKPVPGDGHKVIPVVNSGGWYVCERCGLSLGPATPEQVASYERYHEDEAPVAGPLAAQLAAHDNLYSPVES